MGHLRVQKESNKKQRTIKSIPKELLVEILAKVGTRSIVDLCMVKPCCKEFLDAAEDDHVYRHVSMENFALVPLPWFTREKESSFLKRCRESGNSEIAYREGMVQCFSSSSTLKLGLQNLKKAMLEGHHEAKYVYCMLLMCGEDEGEREEGFRLFCSLEASTCVGRCRKRVKSFVRSVWVRNNPLLRNHNLSFCCSGTCGGERLKKLSTRWSWPQDDEDVASIGVSCQRCRTDHELGLFCNIFGV
ncbi:F-box protein At2g35280 [Cajanus cajan]|uniref:F-box protein At1g67623 family n=1 Tax=Cajanus cajan TaxID=3821 RepID=A0A151STK0_CAJCA|nr:F-box protein At2g35280 [Cajanus cajan]KYP58091.1 Putative F-box protein At1g67623 family [Cajanus cajan]